MALSPSLIAVTRGLRGRCPACGKGQLFMAYLKQAPACSVCGAATGEIAAEDGPPWLTVLFLGPLLAALTFISARHEAWPLWIRLGGLGTFAILAVLVMLPRVKGGLIGVLWGMRARD
ncbi:MAG: DUF983 domain-containing protein [Hyphomonas sp.]|jgi:uncharacterized protein (DUF983 family)|uniref:DUF983 domain-containing protein n=1 Tax=Hyphomonas sp. TaxID=87 RepID=UPI001834A9CB|nr:DUF983 domain-containing protein [Hyphomonas sp.]MBU3922223.1 DUF983 domain-containing protein [Alphaproteobacteria bacterium]MBA3069034.1 DUF983 domain-containing protein [Hyphomonas sp.]MBU4061667.1 DUF983 domain-containing protein [Alphaproteobacteria bacterium]MBU4163512.1 DUF983 domain-containing protein [Alphaproteobacteria bacterium]MBU4567664.1 DUF983 domain-containing protein [Alphaproteobacteria bacterium]